MCKNNWLYVTARVQRRRGGGGGGGSCTLVFNVYEDHPKLMIHSTYLMGEPEQG